VAAVVISGNEREEHEEFSNSPERSLEALAPAGGSVSTILPDGAMVVGRDGTISSTTIGVSVTSTPMDGAADTGCVVGLDVDEAVTSTEGGSLNASEVTALGAGVVGTSPVDGLVESVIVVLVVGWMVVGSLEGGSLDDSEGNALGTGVAIDGLIEGVSVAPVVGFEVLVSPLSIISDGATLGVVETISAVGAGGIV